MHCGMFQDEILHLIDADFFASAIYEIAFAPLGIDVASPLRDDVAHTVEAVCGERASIYRRSIIVPENSVWPTRDQFAFFAIGHFTPFLVHYLDFVIIPFSVAPSIQLPFMVIVGSCD